MVILDGDAEDLEALAAQLPDQHLMNRGDRGPVLAYDSHSVLDFANQVAGSDDPGRDRRLFSQAQRELARRWRQELSAADRAFWADKNLAEPPHAMRDGDTYVYLTTYPGFRDFYFEEYLVAGGDPLSTPGAIQDPEIPGQIVPKWDILASTFESDGVHLWYKPGTPDGSGPEANGIFWYESPPSPFAENLPFAHTRSLLAVWDMPTTMSLIEAVVEPNWPYQTGDFIAIMARFRNGYRFTDTTFAVLEKS